MPQSEGRGSRPPANGGGAPAPAADGGEVRVGPPIRQYLMAPRPGLTAHAAGVRPMAAGLLNATVDSMGLDVVKRIKRPRRTLATFGASSGEATDILVTNMEPERAQLIAATAPNLTIGENARLQYGALVSAVGDSAPISALLALGAVRPKQIRFRVLGEADRPLAGATVTLGGDTVPQQGLTDQKGELTLPLHTLGDRPARSLFVVKPGGGYWDLYLTEPTLSDGSTNVIRLQSFGETVEGFPTSMQFGWGQRLMGLDRLPAGINGEGVKIAIVDSGADNTHPLLGHIRLGRDLGEGNPPNGWTNDLVGHGSHCAGVIAARSTEGQLRGFAPEAEVHVLKVFPGGRYDGLIDALDYCIDHQIDVVNMSLGGDENNPAVEDTLAAAALNGIVCIVAAGNSGDEVKFPARSPNAIAVAAVGDLQEVRPNTWDSSTFRAQYLAADGVFSPTFTCHGPEITVCAPGVGIISTVPGGAFESQSGTSMAAPHVTGLAALLLAHHPVFRSQLRERNQARVAGLFSILRSMCQQLPFGADRTGAGLPTLAGFEDTLVPGGAAAAAQGGAAAFVPPSPRAPVGGGTGAVAPQGTGPQMAPQGVIGQQLGGALGGLGGGLLGQAGLGQQLGSALGTLLPFSAGPPVTQEAALIQQLGTALADPRVIALLQAQSAGQGARW
ncbi:S8 family serine peptidase [Geodermatophilus sp. DSM 45219]|uniref:S8 family serine peptidase n=1 Tax=Geodermatophilus sp. DSM 45219 TaxID=1881103 RepID=UPI000891D694|nr:S8 family serine peptidase [Geodermatophilus sp. DSM 45219]SDN95756.1 Serine protease, subtilisin family [Geodermatophilus sp. DSM 45219]